MPTAKRPNIQTGDGPDDYREMTKAEYDALLATGWTLEPVEPVEPSAE